MHDEQGPDSHLFTVRVWVETAEDGHTEWRGKLSHIPSGQIRHFRGWTALIPLILDILRRYPSQPKSKDDQAGNAGKETY